MTMTININGVEFNLLTTVPFGMKFFLSQLKNESFKELCDYIDYMESDLIALSEKEVDTLIKNDLDDYNEYLRMWKEHAYDNNGNQF